MNSEIQMAEDIAGFAHDPVGFVHYAYPWGMEGTILAQHDGPDKWQVEQLQSIGERLALCEASPDDYGAILDATASGHGIGKSADMSWLIGWFMSTAPHANIVATANTRAQLLTKLWRELNRWHKLMINSHWFEWTATAFCHKEHRATWRANAIPWSENNSEAFAGLHEKHVMVLFDEASAIADVIFEVTEGALTTPGAIWVCTGNPTRNSGRFRECFEGGKFSHRWTHRQVDSRTCKMTNKTQLEQWITDYGDDSDFARVRIKGEFPRAGSTQFISVEPVTLARKRDLTADRQEYRVLGIDVARFGDDRTIFIDRGHSRVHMYQTWRGLNTMEVAARAAMLINENNYDTVFVDGNGLGAGVVDRLRQLGYAVIDVQFGAKARESEKYFNKRAECWGGMRDWLQSEVDIPDVDEFAKDLTQIEYGYDAKMRIQLEKKEDMKKRGLDSPDIGDALSLTFAEPISAIRRSHHRDDADNLRKRRRARDWRAY